MRKEKQKNWIVFLPAHLLVAFTLTMLADVAVVSLFQAMTMVQFAAAFAGAFLLSVLISLMGGKTCRVILVSLSAALWMILAAGLLCWNDVSAEAGYVASDSGKSELYAGQQVMLLVPHQDDDVNVLGGVIEEYRKYGSEVFVVFSTNGDYYGLSEVRFREAVSALARMGVAEDHVIFLGYGDQWSKDGPHIYNGEPETVLVSAFGRKETYGTDWHPAYREGQVYTREHFLGDIESVILEYRPDVLYCVDYDYNIDHKALMLGFEQVMGRILKTQADYRPLVFKGYAYNTAWESAWDYYDENLPATCNPFEEPFRQRPAIYRWEDRVRLPVHAESLSRSAVRSGAYDTLSRYASQGGALYVPRVYNCDKIFWQRDTGSLCLHADIRVSSGNGEVLKDYMLLDNHNLVDSSHKPYDGAWVPAIGDKEKCATVTFDAPRKLEQIVLYDHPDPEKNIRNAVITFDDGTTLETGPLDPGGAGTRIGVEKAAVGAFTVTLVHVEGQGGLTEIEAFEDVPESAMTFVKIMDGAENFAYDYWIDPSGKQTFSLYVSGSAPAASPENYTLSCTGSGTALWQDGHIVVECPEGESCEVTVREISGKVSDTVFVQNPDSADRAWKLFWLRAEEWVMKLCDRQRFHERLVVCRVCTKLPQKLGEIFS